MTDNISKDNFTEIIKDITQVISNEYRENRKKLYLTIFTFILMLIYYIPNDTFILGFLRFIYILYFLHHVGWFGGRWLGIYYPQKGYEKEHATLLAITTIYCIYPIPNKAFYFINILIFVVYAIIQKPTHKYIIPKGRNILRRIFSLYGF